ncbi:MAG: hypothetical protein HYZ89_06085, partial [Candidatus Omnitrophica bacterium]|nr:hypothetical protein [Candidatus Omnitrophota bacterium]
MQGDTEHLKTFYAGLSQRHAALRKRLGRPLTLSEKILAAHAVDSAAPTFARGA